MKDYTLAEIAEASGIPERTVRFYIARGLLNGPVKAGRAAAYTAKHLAHLEQIKKLQSKGLTLSEIARTLAGAADQSAMAPATPWWQHAVADDVIVWIRAGTSPWRTKQLLKTVEEFARRVKLEEDTREGETK